MHARHIKKLAVVDLTALHGVKALLHTVAAHADIVGKIDHLSGNTFRSVADKADLFIFVFFMFF